MTIRIHELRKLWSKCKSKQNKKEYCNNTQILFGKTMLKKVSQCIFIVYVLIGISGCVAVSVVSATVGVATTVVGGAVDVVDAVTPDIMDDDDEEEEEENEEKDEPNSTRINDKV